MTTRNFFAATLLFVAGMAVGIFGAPLLGESFVPKKAISQQVRQGANTYTNPLLECEVAEGSIDARKENFLYESEEFIAKLHKGKKVSDVAFYFRDLNNGPTFGVNLDGEFFPASLLKVPVMMVYYHLAEKDPGLLKTKIRFEAPIDFGVAQSIVPRETLQVGEAYQVEELIQRMIVYSDNQALSLLTRRLSFDEMQNLFSMIGADTKVLSDPMAKLTVKEYAGFFRILFNSSYLSREYSERALALLAATDYQDALPAGVPDAVAVAHKFGEAGTEDTERQLHDCGVVYFPNHPYLLCVMTRGQDINTLKESIRDFSQFVYQKIDEQY